MKQNFVLVFMVFVFGLPILSTAQDRGRQHGIVIKMRMADCIGAQHGIMAALSGSGRIQTGELCPEYVLLSDQVVYTMIGKSSNDLLPLAEVTQFRFQKNQLLIRIDDAKRESRFEIKAMVLRAEWERSRQRQAQEEEADDPPWRHLDSATAPEERP
jgi:hypothetical protein